MVKKQYMEMSDAEHGLVGLGKISYNYEYTGKSAKLSIVLNDLDFKVEHKGSQANKIWRKMINDTNEETFDLVKRLACDSVGIPTIRLKERSRKKEVVFARYMVMWFMNKYMNLSLAESGKIFNKDHATALHGIREFNKQYKYMSEQQEVWKKNFINKCVNRNLFANA